MAAAILCVFAPEIFAQGIITTLAGTEWVFAGDGKPAIEVPLGNLSSVTTDRSGNLVFADPGNGVVIRLNPSGSITVLAGNGLRSYSGDGGLATNAALSSPRSATFDGNGNLYIADTENNRIRMVTPDGIITTVAGNGRAGFIGDRGPATRASLNSPVAVVADFSGTLYISDSHNHRVRRVTPDGMISTWAGNGQVNSTGDGGPAANAALNDIEDMALDGKGNLYLADFGSNRIRKVDSNGVITLVAGDGQARFSGDGGPALKASLYTPGGIAFDAFGNLYISDTSNFRVRKINPQGIISTIAGTPVQGFSGDGGAASQATFASPFGLTLDLAGNLYIADRDNYRIRKVDTAGIISTVAGNARFRFFADGTAAANAFLFAPYGICFDSSGNLYIGDTSNNRVRKVAPSGLISTIAGNGGRGYTGDGGPGTRAALNLPQGVAADKSGNVYIADSENALIRRVAADGAISTVAGNPSVDPGYSGDGGKATLATLHLPVQVALDSAGNLYIADYSNNRIRKVTTDGNISTFAGTGKPDFSGDGGPAAAAALNGPSGLAFDAAGNLYVADSLNARVRRITKDGTINTIAGGGFRADLAADSFPAVQAALGTPNGIAVDDSANVYFSDQLKHRIRKVSPAGIISTIAGNGGMAFAGDGGRAVDASLAAPHGLAIDPSGNLLIADVLNNRIRAVLALPPKLQSSPSSLSFSARSGGGLTDSQSIAISSSVSGLLYAVTANTADGGNWLKIDAASGSTPALIQIVADPTGLSPGVYHGTIAISSANAGVQPQVTINFNVTAPDNPRLGAGSDALTFSFVQGASASTQNFTVRNLGGGAAEFTLSVATDSGGDWLKGGPQSGTATPVLPGEITVQADPGSLDAGTYTGTLTVTSDTAGTLSIPVTMTVSSITKKLLLSQTGLRFTAVSGGGAPLPQNFGVLNPGQGRLDWTVVTSTVSGGDGWLIVSPTGGSSTGGAPNAPLVDVAVSAANLAPGEYYGKIQVFSEAADNSPRSVMVVLNVLEPSNDPGPDVRPTGLIFTGEAGSNPGSQNLFVSNLGADAATYASSRVTSDGQNWFVNAPTNATIPAGQPFRILVQPDFTALAPGIYSGSLAILFNGSIARTVSILSVVTGNAAPEATGRFKAGAARDAAGACSPQRLHLQFISPGPNFVAPATQPTDLRVKVTDDCANPLLSGIVTAAFSNQDPNLSLVSIGDGVWSGTWQPRSASPPQVKIVITALDLIRALGARSGELDNPSLSGTLRSGATPVVNSGVLNAASFVAKPLVAPGGLITVFGLQLADACDTNTIPPFGTQLGSTQVFLDNRPLALLFACKALTDPRQPLDQINAQVPYDLAVNTTHQLSVQRDFALSPAVDVSVASAQPGIFTKSATGSGQGEIYRIAPDGSQTYRAEPGTPASVGDTVVILCSSLGGVSPAVGLGLPAPASPIAQTMNPVLVSIGGYPAQVVSATLEPDNAGRYRVQVIVPQGVMPADAVPVILTVSGQSSPPVTMAVK